MSEYIIKTFSGKKKKKEIQKIELLEKKDENKEKINNLENVENNLENNLKNENKDNSEKTENSQKLEDLELKNSSLKSELYTNLIKNNYLVLKNKINLDQISLNNLDLHNVKDISNICIINISNINLEICNTIKTIYFYNNTNHNTFINFYSNSVKIGTLILDVNLVISFLFDKYFVRNTVYIYPTLITKICTPISNIINGRIYNNKFALFDSNNIYIDNLFNNNICNKVLSNILQLEYDKYLYIGFQNNIQILKPNFELIKEFNIKYSKFDVYNNFFIIYSDKTINIYNNFELIKQLEYTNIINIKVYNKNLYILQELKLLKINLINFETQILDLTFDVYNFKVNNNIIVLSNLNKILYTSNFTKNFEILCLDDDINSYYLNKKILVLTIKNKLLVYKYINNKFQLINTFEHTSDFGKLLQVNDGYGIINDNKYVYYLG